MGYPFKLDDYSFCLRGNIRDKYKSESATQ